MKQAITKEEIIKEEEKSWERGERDEGEGIPAEHKFAHKHVRSKIYETLKELNCNHNSLILNLGVGSGLDHEYILQASENVIGVDVSNIALKMFRSKYKSPVILADVEKLPFKDNSFNFVTAIGLLHHLIGQNDLEYYINEFKRVLIGGGWLVALDPNLFHPAGVLMNILNTVRPGIFGFVPYERALSPYYLWNVFKNAGLIHVCIEASSYAYNRFPLYFSKRIAKREDKLRAKPVFRLFGWWSTVYGQKEVSR
jgi:ubiquinone/menaquinone biosynthesis C-methylase UbiE